MTMPTTMPVVVGADGSEASLRAVDWAGEEAALRGAPLRIVHAALLWSAYVPLVPQPPRWAAAAEAAADEMLGEALIRARAGRPRLEAGTETIDGTAREVLLALAGRAQLVVVGSRGHGGFTELLLGSVPRYLATRAPCPVAVIRERAAGPRRGEIVVGVTGRPDQEPVLDYAFREAGLRRADLRAVHAWTQPVSAGPGDMLPPVFDPEAVAEEEARLLAEALAGRADAHPDVTLVQHVVRAHPAKALIDAAAGADLLVIGAHGRAAGVLGLGATAHAVLHHCPGPVIAVRH
ncbi:universal stress protein [Microbispora sp. RL4-1S]|uniref:Universal stress protein n=1 Tax=Microbispora oryzae TaxID=2806554 RepID=A0A941AIJ1_9ACTN|nr:universal stress protein [Microbispora oryzae]MBP2703917.1 universal stress protein [Microbispora oryzae]